MDAICPQCNEQIPADEINVAKDVAFCRTCNEAYALSRLAGTDEADDYEDVDLNDPPPGVRVETAGDRLTITARCRTRVAFIMVPFTLFWNVMASMFLVTTISSHLSGEETIEGASLYAHLAFQVPYVVIGLASLC